MKIPLHMFYQFRKTDGKIKRKIKVQCFPLYSVLKAIGNPKVDYFSLDIEGSEFQVRIFNEIVSTKC